MYKDVWKRILAFMMAACLVVTLVEWPDRVQAADGGSYYTYQYGDGNPSDPLEVNTVAAVFTAGQNESGEEEILDGIELDVHLNEGGSGKATVAFYTDLQGGIPDSGNWQWVTPGIELQEGTNRIAAGEETRLAKGTTFAVVITLQGASVGTYAGTGQTYIKQENGWLDMSSNGACAAIKVITRNDAAGAGEETQDAANGFNEWFAAFSAEREQANATAGVQFFSTGDTALNKNDMTIAVGWVGNITLNNAHGNVTWNVADSSIVEISGEGDTARITGKMIGETTITATDEDASFTCKVKVTPSFDDAQLSVVPESAVYNGAQQIPQITVTAGDTVLKENDAYQVEYGQMLDGQATLISIQDSNALVDAGTYYINVKAQPLNGYSGSKNVQYIIEPKDIADASIEVAFDAEQWKTQQTIDCVGDITDTARNEILVKGTADSADGDYYLELTTNENGETGISIVGKGNYTGTSFYGTPKSLADAQVTLNQSEYVYTGTEWHPVVTVAVDGKIISAADFDVIYEGDCVNATVNAATAPTVKVEGKGAYYGTSAAVPFTILQKDISNGDQELISAAVDVRVSSAGGDVEPDVEVTYNGTELVKGTDYTISNNLAVDAGVGKRILTGIGNFKGEYTIEYSIGTDISALIASVSVDGEVTYTGKPLEPGITLTSQSGADISGLVSGRDYTVTFKNNVNAGTNTAEIILQGIGTYGGRVTGTFSISQAKVSDFNCYILDENGNKVDLGNYVVEYSPNLEDLKPEVVVEYPQGNVLAEGEDYELEYDVDSLTGSVFGERSITIRKAINNANFDGSTQNLTYEIGRCNLANAVALGKIELTIPKETYNYTGSEIKPEPTLTYVDTDPQQVLVENTDYTVQYSVTSPTEIGTYQVMITGMGNYVGYAEKAYKITAVDVNTLTIEIDPAQDGMVDKYTGNGAYQYMKWFDTDTDKNELQLVITDEYGNTLDPAQDYELKYEHINQVSDAQTQAVVTVKGRGKYLGERKIYYLLAGKLENYNLSITDETLVYTGNPITLKEENVSVTNGKILFWKETLEQGVDYTISYKDSRDASLDCAKNAGMATATIEAIPYEKLPTANGCYIYDDENAKLSSKFTITPKDIDDNDNIVLTKVVSAAYDGTNPVEFTEDDIALEYNGELLTKDDFEIVADSYEGDKIGAGFLTIKAKENGNYTGTRSVPYLIQGKTLEDIDYWEIQEPMIYTGASLTPNIYVIKTKDGTELRRDKDYKVMYYQNNINAGVNTGVIVLQGWGEYLGTQKEIPFTIQPRDIGDAKMGTCSVNGVQTNYTYTSVKITPIVDVQYKNAGSTSASRVLEEGTDYTLSYDENLNAGPGKVMVNGTGNYTGTYEVNFTIQPKNIAEGEDGIAVDEIEPQPYEDGKAVMPIPNVTYTYGESAADIYTLTAEDYTLTYANQYNPGTATVTITGKGNFSGTRTVTYAIGNSIADSSRIEIVCPEIENGTSFIYKGSAYEPKVTVTSLVTQGALEKGTDYEVDYENNENAGTATIVVRGIGNYAGRQELTFTITPKDIAGTDVELSVEGKKDGSYVAEYTGQPVEPEVTLTFQGKTVDGCQVAYDVSHTNKGVVGVTVTVADNPNFTGTKNLQNTPTAKYEIVAASIGDGGTTPADGFLMEQIEPQPLVGGVAEPKPMLYRNGATLVYGTDYTCTYVNNNKLGSEAVVILTGKGNYTGSVRQKFAIRGNIADADISVPDAIWYDDYVVDGAAPTEITFNDQIHVSVNGVELKQATDTDAGDYTITYANNTWVGNAKVTIKGTGNLAGTVTKEVPIKADLSEAAVVMTVGDQKYTGNPVKAVPSLEYYGKALTVGTHFIVHTYENNTNIGTNTAKVVVVGNEKNGFTGTKEANFSIVAEAGTFNVSGVAESYKYRGEAIEPQVSVRAGTKTLAVSDYEVTYGPNTNAGVDAGSIVVKGKNSYAGIQEIILFDIEPQDITDLAVLDGTSNTFANREYTGTEIIPEVTLSARIGTTNYTIPESDYTVKKAANADNTSVGTGRIVITGDGSNIIGSKEISFPIVAKSLAVPAAGAKDTISVELSPDQFGYDGTAKEPLVYITYQYGQGENDVRTLVKDQDYTVAYSNNIKAGKASAIIYGMGNYKDSRTVEFTIGAQDISTAALTLPGGYNYPYMGNITGVEPEVEVTIDGSTLTEGTDYQVTYQNNKACGTATMVITGIGSFTGTKAQSFIIESHDITASDVNVADIPNQAYTGQPIEPELTITCGDYKLRKGVDYELVFTDNHTQLGLAQVVIKGKDGFTGQRIASFTIASDISSAEVTGLKDSYPYTGQAYAPADLGITEVRIGETILAPDSYTLSFADGSDGKSAGKQTLILNGAGSYGGKKELTITITPKNIADADVIMTGFEASVPYSEKVTQNVAFTWGAISLVRDTDFIVTCNPTNTAGVYKMTVTGNGNYTGTVEREFTLEQVDLSGIKITGISSTYTYTGSAIEPKPTVTMDGQKLTEGTDYTISYEDNINAGVATMRITGTDTHYSGSRELTFSILRRSIHLSKANDIGKQIYTGKDITPSVTVTDNARTLLEQTDYTLMYSDNRRAGTGTVTVAGKGNYTATKTLLFDIRPCNVTSMATAGVSGSTITLNWTGGGVVTGYEIYRMDASGSWKQIARTRESTYTDRRLAGGTAYSYKVRTYLISDGETYYGDFSSVVKGTTSK